MLIALESESNLKIDRDNTSKCALKCRSPKSGSPLTNHLFHAAETKSDLSFMFLSHPENKNGILVHGSVAPRQQQWTFGSCCLSHCKNTHGFRSCCCRRARTILYFPLKNQLTYRSCFCRPSNTNNDLFCQCLCRTEATKLDFELIVIVFPRARP